MSLIGHLDYLVPNSDGGDPLADATANGDRREPPRPGAKYSLVYNDPANPSPAYGHGWTLVAWRDTEWHWSRPDVAWRRGLSPGH